MLTEDDAAELYREVLDKIGDSLAQDIEINVFRCAIRGELGPRRRFFHQETDVEAQDLIRVSSRYALVVALRTLLSALDPIFQVSEVQNILHVSDEAEDDEECKIIWALDRTEPTHGGEMLGPDPEKLLHVAPVPAIAPDDVLRIRQRVKELLDLLQDFESELKEEAE